MLPAAVLFCALAVVSRSRALRVASESLAGEPAGVAAAMKATQQWPPCRCASPQDLMTTLPPLLESTTPPPLGPPEPPTTTLMPEHPTTTHVMPTRPVIPHWVWQAQGSPFAQGQATTVPPPVEVEVLSNDFALAHEAKDTNGTLAERLAAAAGVPANRVKVFPWSWTNQSDDLHPLFELVQASSGCDCTAEAPATRTTRPSHDGKRVMSVEDFEKLADQGAAGPDRGPAGRVQLLTQDPCSVYLVRHHIEIFHVHFAQLLGVPFKNLMVVPPLLAGDKLPPPSPAGGAALLEEGATPLPGDAPPPPGCDPNPPEAASELELASEGVLSGASPAAAGAAAAPSPAAPEEANRPWIAWWSVIVQPPNRTFDAEAAAEKLRLFVNARGTWVTKMLPATLARVPGLPFPGFQDRGTVPGERKIPPPEDKSVALGYNPGGFPQSGQQGKPYPGGIVDVEEEAARSIRDSILTGKLLHDFDARVAAAGSEYRNALHDHPLEAPNVVPPLLASQGPDGIHTESPYGPYPVGEPPYAGEYTRPGMNLTAMKNREWIPNWMVAAKVGGPQELFRILQATPLPPRPGEPVRVLAGEDTWQSEGAAPHAPYAAKSFLERRAAK